MSLVEWLIVWDVALTVAVIVLWLDKASKWDNLA